MYLTEEALQRCIRGIAEEASQRSEGRLRYEERIALPFFGAIILRFSLVEKAPTLELLDQYESMLYELVGDEFLVDFMGSVYQRVGVNYERFGEILDDLIGRFEQEPWVPTIHAAGIRGDAAALLSRGGFDPDLPVWEIQPDEDAITLLILGKEQRLLRQLPGDSLLQIGEAPAERCKALFQASCYARRNHISLARLLCRND